MVKNYLKIALRSLLKNKVYAFLNIFGLTVGITCSLLIFLYVQDEVTYDSNHSQADDIYRVSCEYYLPNDGGSEKWAPISAYVAQYFVNDYPEILESVRFQRSTNVVVQKTGETELFHETVVYADSNVFNVFDYDLLDGNPETALKQPNTTVVSKATAMKYFGKVNVIGETLELPDNQHILTVTGVLDQIPNNTHLKFDMLVSFETLRAAGRVSPTWWNFNTHTYLKTSPGIDPVALEKKIKRISAEYILDQETGSGYRQEYFLTSLNDIHLRSNVRSEFETNSREAYVYIFSSVGLFILIIACINFMNLATARSVNRAKEVGVRKVVGAFRKHLIGQFLSESIFIAFVSLVLSIILTLLVLLQLNAFTGKALVFNPLENISLGVALIGITLFVGVVSGSYPAFVLSAFKPTETLKGSFKTSSKGIVLRKGLVVMQFLISIGLIISTLIVFNQLNYMRDLELGFEKERVIFIPSRFGAGTEQGFQVLKDRLEQFSEVSQVSLSSRVPGREMGNNVVRLGWDQSADWSDMRFITVDYDFINTYDLELVAGRGFDETFGTDLNEAFILNETGVNRLGFASPEEAIGKQLGWRNRQGRVIGVLKDFYFMSVQNEIEPFIMPMQQGTPGYLSAKVETANFTNVVKRIESTFREVMPNRIFEYSFLNQDFDQQYKNEEGFSKVFTFFAIIAILIACLGLYGLAAFTAQQKVKEIGIRKVLGASAFGVVFLLSKDFVKLVSISFVIAAPAAYFLMDGWLKDFAERVNVGAATFLIAAGVSLSIAVLTISYQSIKAAFTNPIKALRYE
ncbi:ABC transporter permease [Roseivirga sp. E12]|uniref:ABC transporter permease n=1 Tax=Roseivirga sp. E12 TaxID=2819237 RepID=UPI001ABD02BC|nr:ABC transporter permease [Roseivirga sp. E12]MBO3699507.1 ABC transporter permease [Roseivirga sp. E12]